MKSFILTSFFLFPILLFAQKITPKQAVEFAEKLYQVKILSEYGKDSILKLIHLKSDELYDTNCKELDVFVREDSILSSSILHLCSHFFESEKRYRTGSNERNLNYQTLRKDMSSRFGVNELIGEEKVKAEAYYDSVQSVLQKK